jgi:hypothetical protein
VKNDAETGFFEKYPIVVSGFERSAGGSLRQALPTE